MRSAGLFAAPALVLAMTAAADVLERDVTSTATYANAATSLLTMTNSDGLITGMPSLVTSQPIPPPLVTSQPEVATIPAGLPNGINTVVLNISSSLTSFLVSVDPSTTVLVSGAVPTDVSLTTGKSAGISSDTHTSHVNSHALTSSGISVIPPSSPASTHTKSSGSGNPRVVSHGLLGLGAVLAALA